MFKGMGRTRVSPRARYRGGSSLALRNELDQLARTCVMLRAGAALFTDEGRPQWWGNCQRCGRVRWLSWCHVHTRASWSIRWDLDNAFAWCSGCHRELDQYSERKRDWVLEHIGATRFDALKLRSNTPSKIDLGATRLYLMAQEIRLKNGSAPE